MTEYGPNDQWPDHPKSWWRDVVEFARTRGWRLRTSGGHAWGTLTCPEGCAIVVFSTGRGGESVARSARRTVERCSHSPMSPAAAVARHLTAAEGLTDAAAELIARRACAAAVEEMLELADDALDAVGQQELLDRIDGLPTTDEASPEAVLDEADGRARSAASGLATLSGPVAKPLRARIRAVRARIGELRRHLADRPHNVIALRPGPERGDPPHSCTQGIGE